MKCALLFVISLSLINTFSQDTLKTNAAYQYGSYLYHQKKGDLDYIYCLSRDYKVTVIKANYGVIHGVYKLKYVNKNQYQMSFDSSEFSIPVKLKFYGDSLIIDGTYERMNMIKIKG